MKKGAFYSPLYSLSASKHGQAFAGFKSWCPTISAHGKIRFNSRSSASNEAFCSSVRVSEGQLTDVVAAAILKAQGHALRRG